MRPFNSSKPLADNVTQQTLDLVEAIHFFSPQDAEAHFRRELQEGLGHRAPRGQRVVPDRTHGGIRRERDDIPPKKRLRPMTTAEKNEQALLLSIDQIFASSSNTNQLEPTHDSLSASSPLASLVVVAPAIPLQQSTAEESQPNAQLFNLPTPNTEARANPAGLTRPHASAPASLTHNVRAALDHGRPFFLGELAKLQSTLARNTRVESTPTADSHNGTSSAALKATPDSVMDIATHLDPIAQGGASATARVHPRQSVGFAYATPKMRQKEMKQSVKAPSP